MKDFIRKEPFPKKIGHNGAVRKRATGDPAGGRGFDYDKTTLFIHSTKSFRFGKCEYKELAHKLPILGRTAQLPGYGNDVTQPFFLYFLSSPRVKKVGNTMPMSRECAIK